MFLFRSTVWADNNPICVKSEKKRVRGQNNLLYE